MASAEEDIVLHKKNAKSNVIDAAIEELGVGVDLRNVPSKDNLETASIKRPSNWDAIASLEKKLNQSNESFLEQKLAIETCVYAIDSCRDLSNQGAHIKNIGICRLSGGGKIWSMMNCILHACSKGLNVAPAAMMCKRALKLTNICIFAHDT